MSAELEGAFPNLAADDYTVASPKTQAYNCVAWAAGDASRWWEPGIYWPGPTGDDLAALTGLFAASATYLAPVMSLWKLDGEAAISATITLAAVGGTGAPKPRLHR